MKTIVALALAAGLVSAAGAAIAQPQVTLSDGRTLVLPDEFEGCSGDWTPGENGVQLYNAVCGQSGELALGVLRPGGWMTPEEFVKLTAQEMKLNGDLNQTIPMALDGGKVTFVCWLDDSSDTNDGLALCSAREPTARFSIMRTAGTNAIAMDKIKDVLAQITIR